MTYDDIKAQLGADLVAEMESVVGTALRRLELGKKTDPAPVAELLLAMLAALIHSGRESDESFEARLDAYVARLQTIASEARRLDENLVRRLKRTEH